jgi:drug/metabolite transporter superfamily protein YnfA
MDMSPQAGTRRRSPQLMIGYLSLVVLLLGAVLAFEKWEHIGQIMVAVGGLALLVSLVLELRTRKHAAAAEDSAFAEGGTFGGRRSPQTHTQM